MKRLVLVALAMLALPTAYAEAQNPVTVTGTTRMIAGGAGAQVDAHVSGSRVSYTNRTTTGSEINVFDLATGAVTVVPNDGVFQDSISDISGNMVVFTRRMTSTSTQAIAFVDLSDPLLTVTELAPDPIARRTSGRVGGDTVAFQQFTTASNALSAVCVASLSHPSDPAQCLTDETRFNAHPDVSPDGNVVVFEQCPASGQACDIYSARRNPDGSWTAPVAITTGPANDWDPHTNGSTVVYSSNAAGDYDVYYAPVTGAGPATRLQFSDGIAADEQNPNISGTLISMERVYPGVLGETTSDLYLFDIASSTFYQLPPTPDAGEFLNGVSVNADGTVHVVWSVVAPGADPLAPTDIDLYAFSFNIATPSYDVCRLFDASRSFKAGRVAPLKIRLCDGSGANRSNPSLVLTATGLVQLDGSASSVLEPDSPGQANPDGLFRYDAALGGYVFNLSTAGLTTGTWELQFRVSGDSGLYGIRFDVK